MATLTIVPASVHAVRISDEHQHTLPAGVALVAGNIVHPDPTTGFWALGNGSDAAHAADPYFCANSVAAGVTQTCYKRPVLVDLGAALNAYSIGDKIYLADDGTLATTAGTVSTVVGTIVPAFATAQAGGDKLLRLEL